MLKLLKQIFIIIIFIPSCVNAASERHTEVTVKDKSNNMYALQTTYFLRHGLAKFSYYFVPLSHPLKELLLFKGQTFGDGESCPDKNTDIILEKAITQRKYEIKDFNEDGSNDISLFFMEENCKTGKHIYSEKLLLATKNGFKLKQTIKKEK